MAPPGRRHARALEQAAGATGAPSGVGAACRADTGAGATGSVAIHRVPTDGGPHAADRGLPRVGRRTGRRLPPGDDFHCRHQPTPPHQRGDGDSDLSGGAGPEVEGDCRLQGLPRGRPATVPGATAGVGAVAPLGWGQRSVTDGAATTGGGTEAGRSGSACSYLSGVRRAGGLFARGGGLQSAPRPTEPPTRARSGPGDGHDLPGAGWPAEKATPNSEGVSGMAAELAGRAGRERAGRSPPRCGAACRPRPSGCRCRRRWWLRWPRLARARRGARLSESGWRRLLSGRRRGLCPRADHPGGGRGRRCSGSSSDASPLHG